MPDQLNQSPRRGGTWDEWGEYNIFLTFLD